MGLTEKDLLKLYRNLIRSRKLDEVCCNGVFAGKIHSYYHSSCGQEAVAVGAVTFLNSDDWMVFSNRYTAHCVAKGMDMKPYLAEWYAKTTGCCGGRSGYHLSDQKIGIPGMSGTLGGCFPLVAGLGLAVKYSHTHQIVMGFFGDGAGGRGLLHEAMLMASNWQLPVVWVCENNGMAVMTPANLAYPMEDIVDLASSYHMPGMVVDGQDVIAVYEASHEAIERARNGGGPSLIECKTSRFHPHAEGLPESRPPEEIEQMRKRDPVVLFRDQLLAKGILTPELVVQIDRDAAEEVELAESFADESPLIDPDTLYQGLYV